MGRDTSPSLIAIGRIGRPHGVAGQFYVDRCPLSAELLQSLVERLQDVPTPAGPTPRQLDGWSGAPGGLPASMSGDQP